MQIIPKLFESFKIGLAMIARHKLRAFLTMLGVIIGVFSVSVIVLISGAFQEYLKSEVARLGSDTIYVAYAPGRRGEAETIGNIGQLELTDINYIQARVPEVEIASGYRQASQQLVKYKDKEAKEVPATAVDSNFLILNRVDLAEGRFFREIEHIEKRNVAILSEDVAKELFEGKSPIGKYVEMSGIVLEVIGVSKPEQFLGNRETKAIYLPLTTANSKWLGDDKLDLILCRVKEGTNANLAMDRIWQAMMIKSGNRRVYRIDSSQNLLTFLNNILGGASAALAAVAALSLLVGGIGIMNIMLVSVAERTREIGLRKAVGATKGSIVGQFVTESATLSLVGGLIGMTFAWIMGMGITVLSKQANWPNENGLVAPFPWVAAAMAAAFSAMVGIVFGMYPALRAGQLEPIVALRSE